MNYTSAIPSEMNLTNLAEFIIEKMKRELPSTIVYHSADHTLDVHEAAIRLANLEGLTKYETDLLRAAALFHDSGITVSFDDHEAHSAAIAGEYLPSFGYQQEEIEIIQNMIMSTKLPQNASSLMERVLCDADLDYLGRADFFVIAQKLRLEWEYSGNKIDLKEWYVIQMNFLKNHKYLTDSAYQLRHDRKIQNLKEIEQLCVNGCKQNF
jgi:predicted metal-dependent HD superfamily phosphohydrolase